MSDNMVKLTPEVISEDSLDRSDDAPQSEGTDIAEFEPAKRGRGRPKGYPKTGGRKKKEPGEHDELREQLQRVALGKPRQVSGPTGKVYWCHPTHHEQIEAARIVLGMSSPAAAKAEEPDEAKLRAALLAYAPAPPPPRIEPAPVYEPAQADPSSPGSYIVHDPAELQKYIGRSAETGNPVDDGSSKTFPNGWRWEKVFDRSVSAYRWNVFAPGNVHAGIRRTEEKATALCQSEGDVTA